MLLPALAGAKSKAQRLQCTAGMKQLGLGFQLFQNDRNDMYPPTAYSTGGYQYQLSWDDYLNRYIGGTAAEADLLVGISGGIADVGSIPKLLKCPGDRIEITIPWAVYGQRRTYAMVYGGSVASPAAPLPAATKGVGVYYALSGGTLPDWEPRGYKGAQVKDQAGTLLLVEQPNGRNICGNDWPSFCAGPGSATPPGLTSDCVQLGGPGSQSYGAMAYGLHSKRFNYLFHDGHVAVLKTTDTVGTGTTNSPLGMWTMTVDD